MAYALNKTEMDFCRTYGHSLGNAENAFIAMVAETANISEDDAAKVFGVYKKNKIIKFDRTNSCYTVKHGGFWDAAVIRRALEAA